jgi:hypothetical protein
MEEQELNKKVSAALSEFEALQRYELSADWDTQLRNKLRIAQSKRENRTPALGLAVIVLFFILANLGLILGKGATKNQTDVRDEELRAISNELLINPISISN